MTYVELMKIVKENGNIELFNYMDDLLKKFDYAFENDLLFVCGGEYNGIIGRMVECGTDILFNPKTNRNGVKSCNETDLKYLFITIELKVGKSALAKVGKTTRLIDETQKRPMFFSYFTGIFNPYKTNLEKHLYFIPYIEYIKYLYEFDLLKLKQNTQYNRELKKQGITSNFPYIEIARNGKDFTTLQYETITENAYNYFDFCTYAKNRKAGQNVVDKRKVNRLLQKIYNELLEKKYK